MIRYSIFSPGGNITALVDQSLAVDLRSDAVRKILTRDKRIEQVGFIVKTGDVSSDFHLEMMGGEFCVNAARSAALYYARLTKRSTCVFTVSGLSSKVKAVVFQNRVQLLFSTTFTGIEKIDEGWIIGLQESRFIITEDEKYLMCPKEVIVKYHTDEASLTALVYLLPIEGRKYRIDPWVFVRKTNTLIHESACGSGSIVACRKIGILNQQPSFLIEQPAGSFYEISLIDSDDMSTEITIVGDVEYFGEEIVSE